MWLLRTKKKTKKLTGCCGPTYTILILIGSETVLSPAISDLEFSLVIFTKVCIIYVEGISTSMSQKVSKLCFRFSKTNFSQLTTKEETLLQSKNALGLSGMIFLFFKEKLFRFLGTELFHRQCVHIKNRGQDKWRLQIQNLKALISQFDIASRLNVKNIRIYFLDTCVKEK